MAFKNYVIQEKVPRTFTNDELKIIIDNFADKRSLTFCKHANGFPSKQIRHTYIKCKLIERFVIKLMNGEVIKTPAEYTDGELTKTATYYTKPATLTALKNAVKAKFSHPNILLDYITDKIIKYSNGLGNNTFTNFTSYFGGN